jgi:hypothetical protein
VEYLITSVYEHEDGTITVGGTCVCGYGASMPWAQVRDDGVTVPRCNKCRRGSSAPDSFVPISREAADLFEVRLVMES